MLGTSVPTDFSERIWTTRSFASSPTWRLPSLTSARAVGSAARNGAAYINDETTRRLPIHGLNLVLMRGRILSGASSATTKDGGIHCVVSVQRSFEHGRARRSARAEAYDSQ